MENLPNKIYLQIGEEKCDDFKELHEDSITWCKEKIYSVDLEYFSKDYILSVLLSRRRKLKEPYTAEQYKSHILELDLIARSFDIDLYCSDFPETKKEENGI